MKETSYQKTLQGLNVTKGTSQFTTAKKAIIKLGQQLKQAASKYMTPTKTKQPPAPRTGPSSVKTPRLTRH